MEPDNLMVIEDPVAAGGERVKVLDFGIAKLSLSGVKKTATGTVLGTPLYMSPEQCSGASESTDRSDVYSLGVMLFEMLAGRPPFIAPGAGELIGRHLFQEPPPLRSLAPEAPAELAALVHRLLLKDKLVRPAMSQVVQEIQALQTRLPGGLLPNRRTPRPESLAVAATAVAGNRRRRELASTLSRLLGHGSQQHNLGPVALAGLAVFLLVALVGTGVYRHYAGGRGAPRSVAVQPGPAATGQGLASPPSAPAPADSPAPQPAPPLPATPAPAAAKPPRPAPTRVLKAKKPLPKSIAHED
jgi:hypothetical protein